MIKMSTCCPFCVVTTPSYSNPCRCLRRTARLNPTQPGSRVGGEQSFSTGCDQVRRHARFFCLVARAAYAATPRASGSGGLGLAAQKLTASFPGDRWCLARNAVLIVNAAGRVSGDALFRMALLVRQSDAGAK